MHRHPPVLMQYSLTSIAPPLTSPYLISSYLTSPFSALISSHFLSPCSLLYLLSSFHSISLPSHLIINLISVLPFPYSHLPVMSPHLILYHYTFPYFSLISLHSTPHNINSASNLISSHFTFLSPSFLSHNLITSPQLNSSQFHVSLITSPHLSTEHQGSFPHFLVIQILA